MLARSTMRDIMRRIESGELTIQIQPSEKSWEEWIEERKQQAEALNRPLAAEDWEVLYP